jgi:DNA replication protein DnaC
VAYDAIIVQRASARLEEDRRRRERERKERRAFACAREPRLEQLDREIQSAMPEVIRLALRRGESPAAEMKKLQQENLARQEEYARLLEGLGLAPDALADTPACPLCGDRGWQGARMCACLQKRCAEEQMKELSKLLLLGEQSFDTFQLEFYSPELWPGQPASPRANMELVYEVCLNYAEKFGRFPLKNLFLSGPPGLGKTFLSACIARSVSQQGRSVVYDTAQSVFGQFENRKFQRDLEEVRSARDDTRRYLTCDLLILDDLGSELTTPFVQSALYELVNSRLSAQRHTVISSNLSMEEAARRYSPAVASRLEGEYHVLRFFGEDIRLLKKRQL